MRPIEAVLFDLDGTLLDTTELIIESFNHTIREHLNRGITKEELFPSFGKPLIHALEELSPGHGQELILTYRQYNHQFHDEMVKVFDHVSETLEKLKEACLKLAIVTSKGRKSVERGLNLFQLERFFDVIITVEDTNLHKPHPEPIIKALELLEINASKALMVGDSPHDIKSAHLAGVKAAAVRWSALPWPTLMEQKPDYVLETLADLLETINNCNNNPLIG